MTVPRSRNLLAALTVGLLAGGLAAAPASAAEEAPGASPTPIVLEPQPGSVVHDVEGELDPALLEGATPAVVDPSVRDTVPTMWERIVVAPDGRTLTVYFWSGTQECYGLGGVEVARDGDRLTISLWTGRLAEAPEACIDIAQLYHTGLVLDEPLVVGGPEIPEPEPVPAQGGMGPGISVEEAIASDLDEPLLVNGTLLVDEDGTVRLFEALSRSQPPQGVGASLIVEGFDESSVEWNEADGVRWSAPTQVLGVVSDGILTASPTLTAMAM
jgi:hypothetical protein